MIALFRTALLSVCLLPAVGCGAPAIEATGSQPTPHPEATAPAPAEPAATAMIVHKTPWCGCCQAWVEQAEAAGFTVTVREVEDLRAIKQALGVPPSQVSCHTAEVGGYFVEGHVPFDDIKRLLVERPQARGLAVPGMPLGSPGMEAEISQPYTVNLVGTDGGAEVYAEHGGDAHH